jgi:hypothetical protein
MPALTAKKFPADLPVSGSIDTTPNQNQTTDRWNVNIKVRLNEPAKISGDASMKFKPTDLNALFDQAQN